MSARNADRRPRFAPRLDALEDRSTPAQFGVPWGDPTHLTLSFAPDGTTAAGRPSRLSAALDAAMPRAAWQEAVLRAVQTWSELANVNVGVVADGGQPFGSPGPTQGDPRFGDIRVGGLPMTGEFAVAVPPDPFLSGTFAGDVFVNTAPKYDAATLYAVALHEVGHALGLGPSTDPKSVMYHTLNLAAVPTAGDIAALRALYGARSPDANEGQDGNNTIKYATRIRFPHVSGGPEDGSTPLVQYGDITTRKDVDFFWAKPPAGYTGPMTVRVQTAGVSLLAARVTVYDPAGRVVGQATGSGVAGGVLTVRVPAVKPDVKHHIKVEGAPGGAAAVGRYGVGVTFDGRLKPTAITLEEVLRGPYEGLDTDDLWTLFNDPYALYADDYYTDDTLDEAEALKTAPGFATNTHYKVTASLAGPADADFYRVRTPDVRTPQVLTATVRGLGPNAAVPRVEVFDDDERSVPVRVLANGNGTYTVQATELEGNRASYYLRVTGSGAAGNYALDAGFGTTPAAVTGFVSGSLAGSGSEAGYRLYVGQSQLFGFGLTASGPAGSGSVRMTIRRASDPATAPPLFELTARAGETVTGLSTLFPPGAYTVTFTATGTGPLSFALVGAHLTDPVGPLAGDATLAPQYPAPSAGSTDSTGFLYPDGTITFDPYLWVFSYSL